MHTQTSTRVKVFAAPASGPCYRAFDSTGGSNAQERVWQHFSPAGCDSEQKQNRHRDEAMCAKKNIKEEKLNRKTKSDLACRAPVHRNEKNICEARELLVLLQFARAFDNGLRLLMRRVQLAYLSRSIILKRGSNVMTEY